MISRAIPDSPDLSAACAAFTGELGEWAEESVDAYANETPTDGHDQGTFTISWGPYLATANGGRALDFLCSYRDRIAAHFHASDRWRHGYWRMQEAHHGTEHYELFLGALWRFKPGDERTAAQLVDAAEHFGNWSPDVPPWFDWDSGTFYSMWFGADGIDTHRPSSELNLADHFRCTNICLLAHEMTGEQRYLDLAAAQCERWATAIVDSPALPVGIRAEGPVYQLGEEDDSTYYSFAGAAPPLTVSINRAENLLASAAVNALLNMWRRRGNPVLRQAVEKILEIVVTQLDDPDAGVGVNVLRCYRKLTGDTRYDEAVRQAAAKLAPRSFSELSLEPEPPKEKPGPGIGKRMDKPPWFEDGQPQRHSPVLLAHAAEIDGNEELATRAVDLARTQFALARQAYPDGRRHGCGARSISAIARGHGRENNTGVVTAVLEPVLEVFQPALPG